MAEQFRAVTQRFCTSVFLLCAGVCLSPLAFSAPVSGDIDGDGLVGLADALRIVRHIDNVELLSGDALGRADVYPVADGDGVVDVNDARTILRVAVGSISLQEVTGETEWDAPRITSFSPLHGGPGTQVVISGENFPHSAVQSGSVVVAFNHTLASITSSTTTSLTVTVPDDAISGLLRVLTPGGLAVSGTNFTVTNLRNGSLELGGRAAPDAYEVATPYGTSAVGGDGSFQVDLPDDGVGLVGAVPIGPGASYLALQLPGEGTRGTLVVDAQSTAETLVFMHPFLMTDNGDRATMIVNIVTSDAAVAQLAQTISTRYPEGADGLDDAEVRAAWADAVASVLSQLPDTRTIGAIRRSRSAAGTTAGVAAQRTTITTPTGTKIRILRMDPDYFKLGYDAEEQAIVPSLERDYSPVDWLLSITRLDPDSLPNGVSGGPGEGFSDLKKRDMDQLGNYQKTCMVAANQWTAKLDVLGQGMDFVLDSAFDFVGLGGEDGMLPLEDADEDSLYIIRAYSGAWKDHLKLTGDDVVAINAIAGAPRLAHTALGVNATLALLDAWSLVAGDEAGFKQEAIKAGAQAAIDEAAHKIGDHALGGMTEREALQVILDVTVAAGRGVAGTAAEAGLASAQEKLIKTAAKALTGAGAILEALSTLSTLGRIGERVSGEMGYLINVYGLEMSPGPSPMESTFVMVGDPFSPAITSVTPMEAAPGATVTIRGTRFDPRPTYNTVLFNDKYKGTITAASAEELTVVVPIDAPPAECTVSVATQRGFVKAIYTDFELIALPTLLSLSPTKGFGLSPNASSSPYSGYSTRITLAGLHLIDNAVTDIKLYIKGVDVTVGATWSNEQVSFNCPAVAFGPDAEIVLTYMHDEQLKNTDTFLFHVYGPPSLQTVTPTEVTTASVVTVASGALHTSELYIEDQKYSWRSMAGTGEAERQFNMPDLALDDGEEVTLTIWNPAGKTEETLTWSTRIEANPPDDLADGMTFHVSTTAAGMSPDGKLTLAEALAASRGNLNLWGNGYDDFDETAVYTWKQSREPIPDTDPVEYEYTMGFMGVANSVSTTNRAGHEIMGIRAVVDYFSGEDSDQAVGTINLDTGAENYSLPFAEATKPYPPERTFAEEEGDRVTGVKGDHGANHRDTIDTTLTGTSENLLQFEVPAFNLGVQDRLILGYSAITVAGAAAVGEKSVLSVAEFTTTTPLQLASFSGVNTTLTTIGIAGDDVHGATISVAFRDITGTAIAMANSTGNRFSFPGIDASGDAPAGRASEPLISLTDCKGNEFTGVTELALANGTGAALAIVGGSRNTFPILNITSCEKGVVLENAIDHTLTLSVTECFGDAVTLKGAQRCTVNPKFILDNVGDGIVLENTVDTVVSGGDIAGNDGDAIRITGNSWGNHVKGCRIGVHEAVDNIADDIPNGNVGDGIVLSNGARENVIENVQIGLCGGNGVSMRGQGTDSNVLKTVDIGYFYYDGKTDYDDVGNGGIGVLIEQGAKHNRVESTDICHNAEGGIIIRDAGTDHTFVGGGTRIGALIYNYENGYRWVAINQKWGVRVTGGAAWTRFDDCIIGTHPEGGVYVSDLPMYKDGENWPVSLEKIRVAYAMWSHSPVVDSMDSEYQSTGVALQFEGVEQARLSDIKTRRHTGGVRIAGAAAPKEWEFQGVYLGSSTGDGLYAEKLTDVSFDGTYASSHRGAGMRFIDGANLTIATTNKALTFNSNWDAAISLESCHDILLKSDRGNTLKLSRTQDGNSLRILNCQNVQVHAVELPSSYRSNNTDVDKGNAVWVENSSNIELLGLAVAGHRGRGVYIKGSTDVTLGELGDIPSLFTTNSTVSGAVCVEDSTNVLIGGQSEEPACVFKQTYCSGPVIEVRASGGARTSRDASGTTISSCLFQYRFYAGAIVLVDGASNVTVGDPVQSYANLFEGGDPDDPDSNGPRDRPGVEVRGSGTNIRILNNRFERMYAAGSYGFRHGVLLSGTDGVVVSGNFVEHTYRSGILLEAGAKNSLIVSNRIENSQDHGILVEGATTTGNVLSQNICSGSTYNPIRLQSGGNEEIDAPVITKYENHGATIQGMLFSDPPAGTRVEVYGGFDDEAAVLVGHAPVIDGQFSLSGYVPKDMEVRALCIHPTGNTSQLGAAQPNGAPPSFLYANTSGDNKDIWLMSQAKGGPVRLTHHVADDGEPVPMARNSGVVFVSDRAGNKDIWHVPFSDGTPVALTTDGADDYSPHCNPYQEQVAFVSERDGGVPHIFIWDSDRRGITQLTSGPGRDAEPAWATYGDSIAFASDRDGSWDIWVINGDGTNLRKWHTNAANERQPTWTSNGQLVFSSDRDGDEELYLSAGVNASQMTSNDAVDSSPSASDTGMTIFVSDRNGDRAAIFWHRNATSARQLVASSVELAAPAIVEHRFVTSCTDQFLETWRQNEEETLRSAASDDVSRDSHGFAEINVDEVAGIADAGVSLPMGLAGDTVPAALLLTLAYDPTTLGLTGEPTGDYRNSDAVFAWLPKAYPDNAGTIQLAWIARQGGSYAGPSFCQLPFMIAKSTTDTFSTVRITRSTAYAADGSALHLDTSDGIVRITPLRLDPPDLDPSSDSGHSSTDNETYLTTLKFIGTAIPGATATLVGDGLDLKSGQADGAGQWAITVTMTAGTHYMQARQSLADGTGGSLSSSLRVIVKISAALVDINTMAENGNANALRVEILADAGAIDVLEENLPVYRRFVEAAGSVPSLQRLQSFIDSANQGGEPVLVTVHNGWNAVASLDDGWVPAETFSAEELGPLVWEWDRDERSYIAYDADQPVPSQNARWLFLQQLPENGRQALLVGIPVEPLAAPSSEIGWNMECAAETKTVSQLSSSRGTVADVWQWNVSEQAYKSLGTEDEVVAGSVYWFYVR